MSRGLGREQRRVLRVLTDVADSRGDAWVLLRGLAGQDPTWRDGMRAKVSTSQVESTRRAVRTLVARGLVEKRRTGFGGKELAVVRLRRHENQDHVQLLPMSIDQLVSAELHRTNEIYNEILRASGSRSRQELVSMPVREQARLFLGGNADVPYQLIFLNPEIGPRQEEWLRELATILGKTDQEAGGAVQAEIQRRVDGELARHGMEWCDSCRAKQRESDEFLRRPPETMTDRELAFEFSALVAWEFRDLLRKATTEDYQYKAKIDELNARTSNAALPSE